jgi:hypothetical protein
MFHRSNTHVLVPALERKRVNGLDPLAGLVNGDSLVNNTKLRELLERDVVAVVVRRALVSSGRQLQTVATKLTGRRRRCMPSLCVRVVCRCEQQQQQQERGWMHQSACP